MPEQCKHESLTELSNATGEWSWERQEDGSYQPTGAYEILGEDSVQFKCDACEELVSLDDDGKLEDE